ncbi:hypothetical protein UFOVP134_16 [uncultured Caudovirales phage]|uniref:Uncharacterized protein n=1 Tax=uncultured Caudovirales phage TaxID=2100421 RepID=A0A6J5LFM4_9CAUD|nr:hypothetical protein UFOVP134_16 [uncultured Caudovirales phage]
MHFIILIITAFIAATPTVPEHAEVKALVAPSREACVAAGEAISSQLRQLPTVSAAGYGCLEVVNPADKPA